MFVVGVIAEMALCVLALFLPTFYSQGWEFGTIFGTTIHNNGSSNNLSLVDIYGFGVIFPTIIVIGGLTLYLIFFKTHRENLIPRFVIIIIGLIPIAMILFGISTVKEKGKVWGDSNINYGSGTSSGMTIWGILLLIALVISFVIMSKGLIDHKKKQMANPQKAVREIKIANQTSKNEADNINPDDWKM